MNTKLKDTIALIGAVTGFGIILNFYLWLVVAMTNPDMSVTVYFNRFGEGLVEMVFFICLIPFIVFSVYNYIFGFSAKYAPIKTKGLSTTGTVMFWTTIATIILIGICLIITAVLQ